MTEQTVFNGIVAVALMLQGLALFLIYRSLRDLAVRVEGSGKDLVKNISALSKEISEALTSIKSMAEGVQSVADKVAATSNVVHKRIGEVDSFLKEMTDAARLEVARIQDVVDTASRQVEDTFAALHRSVLVPVSEISAILRGFRVGLDFFLRRPKSPSTASHLDEEMFIG